MFDRYAPAAIMLACLILAGLLVYSGIVISGVENRDYAAGLPRPPSSDHKLVVAHAPAHRL